MEEYLILLSMVCGCLAADITDITKPTAPSLTAYAMDGKAFMLNCTIPPGTFGPVLWLNPWDNSPITSDYNVIPPLTNSVRVIGSPGASVYNLFIRFVSFPAHNGTWTCTSLTSGFRQRTTMVVLVPPVVRQPQISPLNMSVIDVTAMAWTFTCVAQFAHPPVMLSWKRLSGPSHSSYFVPPPRFVVSSKGTMSSSLKLVLTPGDSGSVFACVGKHPAFGPGNVYEERVMYGLPRAEAIVARHPSQLQQQQQAQALAMGTTDYAIVIVICGIAAFVFVTGALLFKARARWQVDVRLRHDYIRLPTAEVEKNGSDTRTENNGKVKAAGDFSYRNGHVMQKTKKTCLWKLTVGAIFAGMLLFSLSLAVPIYIKGIIPPSLGTDSLTSVVAGNSLWLDCSQMATPSDSVLEITWYKDRREFYHQITANGKNIGFPENSTFGFRLGFRVSSIRLGQINLWPILPGEDGVFMCAITKVADNDGKTFIKRKTFGVFVIAGLIINTPLLVLLGTAILSALGLVLLGVHHSLRCTPFTPTIDVP